MGGRTAHTQLHHELWAEHILLNTAGHPALGVNLCLDVGMFEVHVVPERCRSVATHEIDVHFCRNFGFVVDLLVVAEPQCGW